jgi:hypothetical protein
MLISCAAILGEASLAKGTLMIMSCVWADDLPLAFGLGANGGVTLSQRAP